MPSGYYLDVTGHEKLLQQLKAKSLKGRVKFDVAFGYAAQYAVYVHEDPFAFHPIGKWKFLTDPLRRLRGQMGKIIRQTLLSKRSLEDGVMAALDRLREESQDEVPIDTGFLHDSWFQRLA